MRWRDLLFLHWPVAPAALRDRVPPGLELETFDGAAWLGVVPFTMHGVRHRLLPPIPGAASFAELNVRTYVRRDGVAGVWFFSLDAASRLAVRAARLAWRLPYYDARMRVEVGGGGEVRYASRRVHRRAPPAALAARYRPTGGLLAEDEHAHWLTARYALFAADRRGGLYRGDIEHPPWPLRPAEAEVEENTMTAPLGVALRGAPLLHFADPVDVRAWPLVRVG